MKENTENLVKYFKKNKGFVRLMNGIKNKYISLSDIKGNVIIKNPSIEEKDALSGVMKKDYRNNKSISINLKLLQERIDKTKFCGADLKEVIKLYYKEDILPKKEAEQKYKAEQKYFFENSIIEFKGTQAYEYFNEILNSKNYIYDYLKRCYNKDKNETKEAISNVCKGINMLPKEKMKIPIFASEVIGNPHGFDEKTTTGILFIKLLTYMNKSNAKTYKLKDRENLAELYYDNNLLVDDVSNMVLCRNIEGYIDGNERHLGMQGFNKYNEPFILTMYNLSNIELLEENNKYKKVVVMENPAAFMRAMQLAKKQDVPMICSYGQVKLSCIIMLDMLINQGFKIYYSGDIDPEGIQIADRLKKRYADKLSFIGFDMETYRKNMSNVDMTNNRINKLNKIEDSGLKEVAQLLEKYKKAAYEEKNILGIVDFIDNIES